MSRSLPDRSLTAPAVTLPSRRRWKLIPEANGTEVLCRGPRSFPPRGESTNEGNHRHHHDTEAGPATDQVPPSGTCARGRASDGPSLLSTTGKPSQPAEGRCGDGAMADRGSVLGPAAALVADPPRSRAGRQTPADSLATGTGRAPQEGSRQPTIGPAGIVGQKDPGPPELADACRESDPSVRGGFG